MENRHIETQIRQYINESILFSDDTIQYTDTDSLLAEGIVDSVGVMDLVLFVEQAFSVDVDDRDITPDNFDSIERLAGYIRGKQSH